MNTNWQDELLTKIREGELRMHSRAWYRLERAVVGAVLVLTLGIAIFILSLLLFRFRVGAVRDWFALFPWGLVLVEFGLLLLGEWLVRRFPFGYRRSIIYIIGLIAAIIIVASVLIDQVTDLHEQLRHETEAREWPVLLFFYQH